MAQAPKHPAQEHHHSAAAHHHAADVANAWKGGDEWNKIK